MAQHVYIVVHSFDSKLRPGQLLFDRWLGKYYTYKVVTSTGEVKVLANVMHVMKLSDDEYDLIMRDAVSGLRKVGSRLRQKLLGIKARAKKVSARTGWPTSDVEGAVNIALRDLNAFLSSPFWG